MNIETLIIRLMRISNIINTSSIIRCIVIFFLFLVIFPIDSIKGAIDIRFNRCSKEVIKSSPEISTGLNAVYIAYQVNEINSMTITCTNPSGIKIQKFSNMGGGYAQSVPFSMSGNSATVSSVEGDMGYMIDTDTEKYYFWLVNYYDKKFSVSSIEADEQQECESTRLRVIGSGAAIHYYSINGRQCTLDREITLEYQNLNWDDDQKSYVTESNVRKFEYLYNPLTISPPFYCNTFVKISGDQFMRKWGIDVSAESDLIAANGVDAQTEAIQTNITSEESSNLIGGDEGMLGGSAPADFTFYAYVTDGVIHDEWELADDPDFEYIKYRFYERDVSYTFDEEGKYYMRYIGSDASGKCTVIGETYEIGIGASDLRIPNAFSPDGDGVNDIWKVGYRSLVEFKCWIFDRNGRELYHFDKPDMGWDGKYHGKVVDPGVYYYVVEAKGADGKEYKKGGDINIIKYRKIGNSNQSSYQ